MNTAIFSIVSILTALCSFGAVVATHQFFCRLAERWAGLRYDGQPGPCVSMSCPVNGRVWYLNAGLVAGVVLMAAVLNLSAALSWLMPVCGILAGALATAAVDTDDEGRPFVRIYQMRKGHFVDPVLRFLGQSQYLVYKPKVGFDYALKTVVEGHGLSDSVAEVCDLELAVRQAMVNLEAVAPGHDPLAGHHYDSKSGKSRFLGEHMSVPFLGAEMVDSFGGAKCLVVNCGDVVGTEVAVSLQPDTEYRAEKVHGSLQFKGTCDIVERPTSCYTLVFTPEDFRGRTLWVLASAYPGRPDPVPNMEGLVEGTILKGRELLARNITRAIPA